jgi:hypothetical protein
MGAVVISGSLQGDLLFPLRRHIRVNAVVGGDFVDRALPPDRLNSDLYLFPSPVRDRGPLHTSGKLNSIGYRGRPNCMAKERRAGGAFNSMRRP